MQDNPYQGTRTYAVLVAIIAVALIIFLVPASTGSTAQTNEDKWPEWSSCNEAPEVNPSHVQTGAINSPNDEDVFGFTLDKGEYVTIEPLVPEAEGSIVVSVRQDHRRPNGDRYSNEFSVHSVSTEEGVSESGSPRTRPGGDHWYTSAEASDTDGIANSSWQVWAEEDNTRLCVVIRDSASKQASLPYAYEIRLGYNEPAPTPVDSEVSRLRALLEEQNETIAELQNESSD